MEEQQVLQKRLQELQQEAPTGFAHAVSQKYNIDRLEQEMTYRERGKFIEVAEISQGVQEIEALQQQITNLQTI